MGHDNKMKDHALLSFTVAFIIEIKQVILPWKFTV